LAEEEHIIKSTEPEVKRALEEVLELVLAHLQDGDLTVLTTIKNNQDKLNLVFPLHIINMEIMLEIL
tara:strand:+ start:22 stop:222 length:201 start_codon:yes stop_codon:yes gene_type:complete